MKFRTKLVRGVLTGAACLGLSVAPAFAATGALGLVGQTTQLTPVQLQGGGGTYVFADVTAGPVHACVVVATNPAAGECTATSSGSYNNVVCGTGTVFGGTSTLTVVAGVGVGDMLSFNYGITFAAGVGVLTGTDAQGGTAVAAVDILPTGGNCVSGVTQFTATLAGVDA